MLMGMLLVMLYLWALVALDHLCDLIQRVSDRRRIQAAREHNARIWGKEIA